MIDVEHRLTRKGLSAVGHDDVELISAAPDLVVLALAGVQRRFEVADHHGLVCVDSPLGSVELESVERFPDATEQSAPGSLLAPMPGAIVRIAVVQGEHVQAGQPLLWLEAMKMQHQISAPVGGTVTELHITEGQLVDVGAVLAVVTEEGT
jgi:propionyl-CoA carboxylase alpha chain